MERGKSKEKLNSLSTLLKNFSSYFSCTIYPTREKVTRVSPFLEWGTTRSLRAVKTLYTLSVKRKSSMIVYEGSRTGRTRLENS